MFTVAHNTFFVIVYGLATSFDLQYGSSSGKLYKNMNVVDSTLSTVFTVYICSCITALMVTYIQVDTGSHKINDHTACCVKFKTSIYFMTVTLTGMFRVKQIVTF